MSNVIRRLRGGALCLLIAACLSQRASAGSDESRLDDEARTIFSLVLSEEKAPNRCQYELEWDTHPVPEHEAREVFKITMYGQLVAPSTVGAFQSIVDPHDRYPMAFCSATQLRAYAAEKLQAFETSSDIITQIDRTLFTYPVFDKHLRTAIVVVSHIAVEGHTHLPGGGIGTLPAGFGAEANVYRKIRGKWTLVGSRQLEMS